MIRRVAEALFTAAISCCQNVKRWPYYIHHYYAVLPRLENVGLTRRSLFIPYCNVSHWWSVLEILPSIYQDCKNWAYSLLLYALSPITFRFVLSTHTVYTFLLALLLPRLINDNFFYQKNWKFWTIKFKLNIRLRQVRESRRIQTTARVLCSGKNREIDLAELTAVHFIRSIAAVAVSVARPLWLNAWSVVALELQRTTGSWNKQFSF